ncbi:MAG TPA: alpha/beta fold hydrolase [Longimicrobiales bacterium]
MKRALLHATWILLLTALPAAAQDPSGCWAGTIGAGPAQRRAALELERAAGAWRGAIHVLSRSIVSDSLTDIRVADGAITFSAPSRDGRPAFSGRLADARIEGEVAADTLRQPFGFTRATPDPALALAGYWSGGLYQGEMMALRMGLEFVPAPCGQVLVTMDSPDQSVENLPVTAVDLRGDSLFLELSYLGGTFRGAVAPGATSLAGDWVQGGTQLGLRLVRSDSATSFSRPQEPKPPFPYDVEEVTYHNATDSTRFAATLTLPRGDGPFPAAVLITGSGAQNRDETVMGHRPFLIIADHLTRNGIAVLRADDRGVGGSTGSIMHATIDDNVGDALAAVELLRAHPKIDAARIGVIGHSEGGWVGPLAASRSDDIAFVVMLAGPAVSGEEILYAQTRAISAASDMSPAFIEGSEAVARRFYAIIRSEPDSARAVNAILALADTILRTLPPDQAAALDSAWSAPGRAEQFRQSIATTVTPWFRFLLTYDPAPALDALRVPVLALFGELDLQVPPQQSTPVLERLWADHPDATIHVFPGLNHLFQHAESGLPAEYAAIEETFAPAALEMMTAWIRERVGRR